MAGLTLGRVMRFGFFIAVLLGAANLNAQTRLLRHPSYSNGKIVFSYFGSLWLANDDGSNVQRLTVNKARDVFPRFSPDGKWIAFSSNREGNYDVYVMPVTGGKPTELTFHTADDLVVGWTPDSKKIIFQSSRNQGVFPGVATLFEISAEGGMEAPLPTDWGSWASYSPDGTKLAFTRHPGVWSRKHYRGSYAVDLWLADLDQKQFKRLGNDSYKGNCEWPMYGHDGAIYFVADRLPDEKHIKFGGPEVMKSANNIWKVPEGGGDPVHVTHHEDGNLFFPSMSGDGKTIVYEENFEIWKLDVESGKTQRIPIEIHSDLKETDVELRTIAGEAESFNLSPSGKRAAIATHGEIFTIATDRGEVQRVSETPWREEAPRWSPNGKWIAFISDRSGREEVWMADELGHGLKQLSDFDCDKGSLAWSPDSKSLLWAGSDHKLRLVHLDTEKTDEITSSDIGPIESPQFSPDGKWVSYSKEDKVLRNHVCVKKLDGGDEHVIETEDFILSYGAKWTPDGKKLLLLGGVGAPGMASMERTITQLYSIALTPISKDPENRDVDTEAEAQSKPGDSPRRSLNLFASPQRIRPDVKIDWDGIEHRVKQLTHLEAGSVYSIAPSPDGHTYAFTAVGGGGDDDRGGSALYTISETGARLTRLTQGAPSASGGRSRRSSGGVGDPQWAPDGRSLFYMQGGGIYSTPVAGANETSGQSGVARRVDFTVRMEIDHAAERKQVFEEAWRTMRNRFYDAKMHGVDWDRVKETYEPLLENVADNDELHNVIMQMIGELNASHTGITGGGADIGERIQTRYPGFNLEPDESGYYKVSYIYKKGPADHDYVKLHVGNYILAVNGHELKTGDNYWKLFNLVPGRKFEFTVNAKPQTQGAWTVGLEPLDGAAQSALEYERWVDARREMVEKLSDGQIGYLHIKAMDAASFQRFERDLLDNLDKKALLIDERFNGGGGIDQELLEILNQRKKYEFWKARDSIQMPRPVHAFFGPMAVLQNERSASDAEMFPEGFRTLGLGKVIGVPTYGAVIGTGSHRLMDGSAIRTPSVGVFTSKGVNLENYGVQPDVSVDNTPADFLSGHDRQIEKAVELLLSDLANPKSDRASR